MDLNRAIDLINSRNVDVYCKKEPVVIKAVDKNSKMAKVKNLSTNKTVLAPIDDLKDNGVLNS
ncbi:H-type small acid-soluble spore protein [Clostridium niameyense]|uniref:H-type small acid-soluble spore protein n=1 Tax=Clostridium niameyense TaxID=1622073 RepID=A0A6M0RB91_9CLOT|nr:H-type small acid-soluble spore protein [Clostridium niameyense]NEZ47037.1 H-type small acid-soluble spore protein [Clostridium niameyense]